MKKRLSNIFTLIVAITVAIASNGLFIDDHFCNTDKIHNYSVFTKTSCEKDIKLSSCCEEKKEPIKKNNCCSDKTFFSKLKYDGFVSDFKLEKITSKTIFLKHNSNNGFNYNSTKFLQNLVSCKSPPIQTQYIIANLLQPNAIKLQIFRC